MGPCNSCLAGRRKTDIPLSEGHVESASTGAFDNAQWSEVIFFEGVDARNKDFPIGSRCASGSQPSDSLADTVSEINHWRSLESIILSLEQSNLMRDDLLNRLQYDFPAPRGSCRKRQKIFDYCEEHHVLATKEAPKLEDLGQVTTTD